MKSVLALLLASSNLLDPENTTSTKTDEIPKVMVKTYPKASLIATGISYHMQESTYNINKNGGRRAFNEFNLGLGLEYRARRNFHVSTGFYENSEYKHSFYLAAGLETKDSKFLGAGTEAGLVTGYETSPMPFGLAYLRLGSRNGLFNVRINTVPPIVAAVNVRVNLKKIFKHHSGK